MPCLTLYALNAYKTSGFHYSKKEFLENTFNIEDFFDQQTLDELKNKSIFAMTENLSIFYGRGYTICYLKKVPISPTFWAKLFRFFWLTVFRGSLNIVHKFYLCPLVHRNRCIFSKAKCKCVGEIKPKVSAKSIKFVKLKTLFDTQLYIHAKGEEFLIGLSVFPTEVKILFYNRSKSLFIK